MSDTVPQSVVGIGELLWDCFPGYRRPGGAPANVAFHATQLGLRGRICSRVGDDEDGRALCDVMAGHGLSTELIQFDPNRSTGRVTVDTTDPGAPAYEIHRDVAWDAIRVEPELEAAVADAAAICVGTLAQRSETSRATIHRCLDAGAGALRVYDVNLRKDGYRRDWIDATLRRSNVVKLNLDEVTVLSGMLGFSGATPEVFARRLIDDHGIELVCITRAEDGCILVSAGQTVDERGVPVEVADAVGAGDAFTAALIWAKLRCWPLEAAARLANRVGGLVASREGAMPELREQFAGLLSEESPAGGDRA